MSICLQDVIIIGAGHSGLSASYLLQHHKVKHLVLERGKIGNSWVTQRWNSFRLNTPNKQNKLPGMFDFFHDEEGFCSASDFAGFLVAYAAKHDLPIVEDCNVLKVERNHGEAFFSVQVSEKGIHKEYQSKQVVVASGSQNLKYIPHYSTEFPDGILQVHASEYKDESSLPKGAVMVVGSAQSGCQIADELIEVGRKVFIATSMVGRIPRRYRGRDIEDWLIQTGVYEESKEEITDPAEFYQSQPVVSGVGPRGRTISLQGFAAKGAILLGSIKSVRDGNVFLDNNLTEHIKFGDEFSEETKKAIDKYINKADLLLPGNQSDPADLPYDGSCASDIASINLKENNITSVIWATGFAGDFSYLKFPICNKDGTVQHNGGISDIEGLYFLGLPWLRKRKSGIIWGICDDAEFLISRVVDSSDK